MTLDGEAWGRLLAAEDSSDMGDAMRHLHPYHHKMVAMYRANIGKVPIANGQRAEVYCQFADARIRLTSNPLDALAAADLERAGVSFRAAGDVHSAARLFESAGSGLPRTLARTRPRRHGASRRLPCSEALSSFILLLYIRLSQITRAQHRATHSRAHPQKPAWQNRARRTPGRAASTAHSCVLGMYRALKTLLHKIDPSLSHLSLYLSITFNTSSSPQSTYHSSGGAASSSSSCT